MVTYCLRIRMKPTGMDRREFHQLTVAALGGVIAGATIGCSPSGTATPAKTTTAPASQAAAPVAQVSLTPEMEALIMDEPHTCRGLNSCKGKGRSQDNECAGQGTCASVADAVCGGHNKCKGEGGCGETPGMNACMGKGGCHIPLMESAWDTARAAFETAMKKNDKKFGDAPAKK